METFGPAHRVSKQMGFLHWTLPNNKRGQSPVEPHVIVDRILHIYPPYLRTQAPFSTAALLEGQWDPPAFGMGGGPPKNRGWLRTRGSSSEPEPDCIRPRHPGTPHHPSPPAAFCVQKQGDWKGKKGTERKQGKRWTEGVDAQDHSWVIGSDGAGSSSAQAAFTSRAAQ